MIELTMTAPVKRASYDTRLVHEIFAALRPLSPLTLSCDSLCVRIEKNIIFVKKLAFFRFIRSVDLIGILKFFNFQSIYQNRIRIADAVVLRNRNSCIRFVRLRMEQKQRTAGRSVGADRKTDTSRNHIRSVHSKKARPHIKATNILQRL